MIFIDQIIEWARDNGFYALYGSPEQVNEMMTDTPFASSHDGTVIYTHLITDSETTDGRDTATVAVYFCRLCDFDFNGENLLPVQEELKDTGKQLLLHIERGNLMAYDGVRWQYGYDDYAENVVWVCLRVTLTALSADCNERFEPVKGGYWTAMNSYGQAVNFVNIVTTNGTLEDDGYKLVFEDMENADLVIENTGLLTISVFTEGVTVNIPLVDNTYTISGFPSGSVVVYDWGTVLAERYERNNRIGGENP